MIKKLVLIFFVLFATFSFAQPVRLHVMAGFANYNGDIQQKRLTLSQAKGAISFGGTINITEKLSVRGDYSYAKVGADDKYNSNPGLVARNLSFTTPIHELSLLGEYDLFDMHERKLSPYLFGGVGVFHFNPYTYDSKGVKVYLSGLSTEGEGIYPGKKVYARTQLNIPLGGGLKYALSDDIRIGFEMGLRVLKTDYLDDVSSAYIDENTLLAARGQLAVDLAYRGNELKSNPQPYPAEGTIRGNNKVNDFYYFGLFRIDFRMNWFDKLANSRGGLGCPRKM